jgi:DNA-binding NarL/FixJ family response regulator
LQIADCRQLIWLKLLVAPDNTDHQLRGREKELLKPMVQGNNYKDIVGKAFISYETVQAHVKHMSIKSFTYQTQRSGDDLYTKRLI